MTGHGRTRSALFAAVLACGAVYTADAMADPCKAIPDQGPAPAALAPGSTFAGPVVYVGDGDSFCVAVGQGPQTWVEVRAQDFYAPELHDPRGAAAKATLTRLVIGRRAVCRVAHQSYDRVVARCQIDGRTVGDWMRAAGVAEGGRGR